MNAGRIESAQEGGDELSYSMEDFTHLLTEISTRSLGTQGKPWELQCKNIDTCIFKKYRNNLSGQKLKNS